MRRCSLQRKGSAQQSATTSDASAKEGTILSDRETVRRNAPGDSAHPGGRARAGQFLLYADPSGAERLYGLARRSAVTIGRGDEVDLSLPWDSSVSSLHAEAVRLGAHWLIADEGISRNGTFVNDERVSGRRRLHHGDVIRVGETLLVFNDERAYQRQTTTITDAAPRLATITVLFTDLVGSTELLQRLGDEEGNHVRRAYFGVLRRVSLEHGGREVKNLGDGLMLVFASARQAVASAVGMQRAIEAHGRGGGQALGTRIGLNAGEVISAEDDYFGTPVVVAKRLCDRAQAGQALVSEIVHVLVGSDAGFEFAPLGSIALKGIPTPVTAFELDWRGVSRETVERERVPRS
ncbi:MAG TPA: adenylate/guanylate cyclase domain-containing protein [Solirubrobacteraceae bacterium]|jgi:class 3 adenylate cyclase|nr:adenylate/guanylate cyclase domain-containing protein [Solirubrobacteraceae bacterium]